MGHRCLPARGGGFRRSQQLIQSPHRHPTVTTVPQAIRDAYEIKDDSPCRKYLNGKGLPILASDKVDDRALFEAGDIISNMR